MHKSITTKRIEAAIKSNNSNAMTNYGFCKNCGKMRDDCEPDARNYFCMRCKRNEVFGAEELLFEVIE